MNSTAKNNIIWQTWDAPGCKNPENAKDDPKCKSLATPSTIVNETSEQFSIEGKGRHHPKGVCQMKAGCRHPSNLAGAGEVNNGVAWTGNNPSFLKCPVLLIAPEPNVLGKIKSIIEDIPKPGAM